MNILGVKDHAVTDEVFDLIYDSEYDMYQTFPKPERSKLPQYYESEDYISHTDSQTSLKDKAYQWVKRIMLRKKLKLINRRNISGKLLDIGAGTGDFLNAAQAKGWNVEGVEPNDKAKKRAKNKNIFLQDSLKEIDGKFDVITLWHVLEHVYNLKEYTTFLKDHLAENGTLYIAVPNFHSLDAKYYDRYWAAFDTPRHLHHFSKYAVKRLFGNAGFRMIDVEPMIFDSFYVSLLSEYYKTGKYNYLKALWSGIRSNCSALFTNEFSSHIYVLKHQKNRNTHV